ncbi:MAG: hypothetical protein JEY71_12760 [Sphaerochaeta sp.]|nr:hypothetical protein [Sphaerochaeta sp.]
MVSLVVSGQREALDFSLASSVFDTGRKQGKTRKDIVSNVFKGNSLGMLNDESQAILMAKGAIPIHA